MIEGLPAILGLAVLLILSLAVRFPTRTRVEQWIGAQKELVIQDGRRGDEERSIPGIRNVPFRDRG
jgi:hypothetical protein